MLPIQKAALLLTLVAAAAPLVGAANRSEAASALQVTRYRSAP